MKIMITSDIHGNRLIIERIAHTYKVSNAEYLLICGDIGGKYHTTSFKQLTEKQIRDYISLKQTLDSVQKPWATILGNDDWFEYPYAVPQKYPQNVIPFMWVPITPFSTNREANGNKMEYELNRLKSDNQSIILSHTPPFGYLDQIHTGYHVGSAHVVDWIDEHEPAFWLCGHIHEARGVHVHNNTTIINSACDHMRNLATYALIDSDCKGCKDFRIVEC